MTENQEAEVEEVEGIGEKISMKVVTQEIGLNFCILCVLAVTMKADGLT